MRYLMTFSVKNDAAANSHDDAGFALGMGELMAELKAEAAYFSALPGLRRGYFVAECDNPDQFSAFSSAISKYFNAVVELAAEMLPPYGEDTHTLRAAA